MQAGGLGADQDRRDPVGVVRAAQVDVDDLRPELASTSAAACVFAAMAGSTSSKKNAARQADAQAVDAGVGGRPRGSSNGAVDGLRVVAVVARHHREQLGDVRDRPRHRPDGVEAGADRERPRRMTSP